MNKRSYIRKMKLKSHIIDINIPNSLLDISKIPTATAVLTCFYVILSLSLFYIKRSTYNHIVSTGVEIQYSDIQCPFLQLVPSKVVYYPFSIILSNLVDTEIWKFVVTLLNLIIGGSFIERNWNSSKELLKFTIVIGSLINIIMAAFSLIISFIYPS